MVFSSRTLSKAKDGKGFKNLRAEMYWRLREALDPESGDDVMLPVDQILTAELTAPRYVLKGTDYLIEDKGEIISRIGHSPDRADAVVMAWHRRRAVSRAQAVKARPMPQVQKYVPSPTGWMG